MDGFKTSFARTRQRLMTKTGQSEETVDVEYHYEKDKVFSVEERLVRIQKNAKKMVDLYKDLQKTMTEMSVDATDLYDRSDQLGRPAAELKDIASQIEGQRTNYDETLSTSFQTPLSSYISQYKEARKRTEERTTRRIDMDRYRNEVGKLREKSSGHVLKAKLAPTEEKLKICKEGYEALHEELLRDLPLLYDDRNTYFQYLLAALIKAQTQFYGSLADDWKNMPGMVSHVNDQMGRDHPMVITPVEHTAANVNIRNDPAFKNNTSIKMKTTPEYSQQSGPLTKDIREGPSHSDEPIRTVSSPNPAYGYSNNNSHAAPQALQKKTATALYDFSGVDTTELTFRSGDQIKILKDDGEWWEAELNGRVGLVPANYVRLN